MIVEEWGETRFKKKIEGARMTKEGIVKGYALLFLPQVHRHIMESQFSSFLPGNNSVDSNSIGYMSAIDCRGMVYHDEVN